MTEKLLELAILGKGNPQEEARSICRLCPGYICMNLDGPTSGRQIIKDGKIIPPPKGKHWVNIDQCEIQALGKIEAEAFILPPPAALIGPCMKEDCTWKRNEVRRWTE